MHEHISTMGLFPLYRSWPSVSGISIYAVLWPAILCRSLNTLQTGSGCSSLGGPHSHSCILLESCIRPSLLSRSCLFRKKIELTPCGSCTFDFVWHHEFQIQSNPRFLRRGKELQWCFGSHACKISSTLLISSYSR
jgi:hypothetical protein